MTIRNKSILITGAASGIGKACAELFAREGARLVLADRNDAALQTLSASLRSQAPSVHSMAFDVGDSSQCKALVDLAVAQHGRIDVLIHAAGICLACPLLEMSDDQWRETLRINLDGSFFITREVAKAMVQQKSGTMVLLTSDRGLYGSQTYAHYAASKGGMIALTKSLALSLGKYGVTVNGLNPGMTDTPLARDANPHLWDEKIALDVLGTANLPEQAAQTLLFLAGVGGGFTTGQILGTRLRHGQ
jgi:3-oxoacyl-[acyl-carrier protein] reductase